jgi:uncharacterized protein (DUF58 family)
VKRFFHSFFITGRLVFLLLVIMALMIVAYPFPALKTVATASLWILGILTITDIWFLYGVRDGFIASRHLPSRLSNGDPNDVTLRLGSRYAMNINVQVIDEQPMQFQAREQDFHFSFRPGETHHFIYRVHPTERGDYRFGRIHVYCSTLLELVRRRHTFDSQQNVPVYPSFLQMRRFELMARANRLEELGIKRVRRRGHSMEYDQIREYVKGDDIRTINWKATARSTSLMVNQYQDERAQEVYSVIDMGRVMKMPFRGMTLLDYAINAGLVMSNVALMKHERAGLITFADTIKSTVKAENRRIQIGRIMEVLYNQKTDFRESGYAQLYAHLRRTLSRRSLILLFTNFETLHGLHRNLQYLRAINKQHLLVTIFFEDAELIDELKRPTGKLWDIYYKTTLEKYIFEKREIVKELNRYGIGTILTAPENLTVDTLNRYLEIKSKGLL